MHAILCTANPHKVVELGQLLPFLELQPMPEGSRMPPEIGATFLDNARIKAVAGAAIAPVDTWVIADDSGLCVDALDGAPGVRSARFAGEHADDAQNTGELLHRLRGVTDLVDRSARFTCVLVAISPEGVEHVATGHVEGSIAFGPRGAVGFGYDPIFIPFGETGTFAELGSDVKARMSHRGNAARQLADMLASPALA